MQSPHWRSPSRALVEERCVTLCSVRHPEPRTRLFLLSSNQTWWAEVVPSLRCCVAHQAACMHTACRLDGSAGCGGCVQACGCCLHSPGAHSTAWGRLWLWPPKRRTLRAPFTSQPVLSRLSTSCLPWWPPASAPPGDDHILPAVLPCCSLDCSQHLTSRRKGGTLIPD